MWWARVTPGCNLTWNIFLIQAAVLSLCSCVNSIFSLKLPEVHWNSSNPMFKTSNNDHIVEVNIGDELDFVCPYYPQSSGVEEGKHEYYIIHRVTRGEYENCNIDSHNSPLAIVNCSKPQQRLFFTLIFKPFLPTPNAPEFKSGGTYYFITTSTGDSTGLQNNYKGACYHDNMKLTIKVCCGTTDNSSTSTSTTTTTSTTEIPTPHPSHRTSTPLPPQSTKPTGNAATVSPTANTATSTHKSSHFPRATDPPSSSTAGGTKTRSDHGSTDSNSVQDPTTSTKPYSDNYVSSAYTLSQTLLFLCNTGLLVFTLKSFLLR